MAKKSIGPKGQILIPKPIRDTIGLNPGADVIVELQDDKIVISKPKVEGNYTQHYISTRSPKLKKTVNIKELILKEGPDRDAPS